MTGGVTTFAATNAEGSANSTWIPVFIKLFNTVFIKLFFRKEKDLDHLRE